MTRGHIMGCPFGRVWDTRGPGASFEPVSALPSVAHARGVAAIDDPRSTSGRSGGSARTLPGVSPFTPGACGPELNRREIG